MSIGWYFPSSGGGTRHGFNDAGIETFAGAPYDGLAREIIQNSLDAAVTGESKSMVTVEFDHVKIAREDFPGADALLEVMKKCLRESKTNIKAEAFFKNSIKELQKPEISCLKISDSGTTGLRGDYRKDSGQWLAITKGSGISEKLDPTAGGSYGIGKNAPFVVSSLRTVFYSTFYREAGDLVYRMQGKSILMSHSADDGGYTQGTGFYGKTSGCMPIESDIPKFLCPTEQGCVVLIPGFVAEKQWQHKIVATVVSNFFCAIDQKKLVVIIQDEKETIALIDKDTLEECFQKVVDLKITPEKVENSQHYYHAMKEESPRDAELPQLGHCKMWVRVGEGLPKRVALLRKTGMLITDDQSGIKQWRGRMDFVGVFMCDSDKGNSLLRDMENPEHNAFQPDRAISDQRKNAKKALDELVRWVRESVDALAKPEETESTQLDELSEFFPDLDTPETIPGDEGEKNIEGKSVYFPKPLKKRKSPDDNGSDDEGDEGGAGDDGNGTTDAPGDGSGEGSGTGGTGTHSSRQTVKIEKVRVVSNDVDDKKKTVHFTAVENGNIKITLSIMGDDGGTESISATGIGSVISVTKKERISLEVTLDDPVTDSIVVRAYSEKQKSTGDETTTK